jgi:hypothetical protein
MDKIKACTKCGIEKLIGEFPSRTDRDRSGVAVTRLNRQCKSCLCDKQQKWLSSNPEKKQQNLDRMKVKYHANPEVAEKARRNTREWRRRHPDMKAYYKKCHAKADRFVVALQTSEHHAKKYGYARCNATIDVIRNAYTGRCAICGVPDVECTGKFHMDHNHETGEFRGWLCGNCNKGLGFFRDSEELLIDALHYVMNFQQTNRANA